MGGYQQLLSACPARWSHCYVVATGGRLGRLVCLQQALVVTVNRLVLTYRVLGGEPSLGLEVH